MTPAQQIIILGTTSSASGSTPGGGGGQLDFSDPANSGFIPLTMMSIFPTDLADRPADALQRDRFEES